MLDGVNAERFLTRRRIIEIRQILPDIDRAITDTADEELRAWLKRMREEFLDELAGLEARATTFAPE